VKYFPKRLAECKAQVPLLILIALTVSTQLAVAQSDPGDPANTHGASSNHTVNINVPNLSAIKPPGNVTIDIDAGDLDENVFSGGDKALEVTTNNPNSRAIQANVSNAPNADDIRLLVKKDSDFNWRVIYGASGQDPTPSKRIIDGIDGVHEKSYPINIGAEVGPDFDPTSNVAFEVTYTLVAVEN
jgi:hypothetical protein